VAEKVFASLLKVWVKEGRERIFLLKSLSKKTRFKNINDMKKVG